MQKFYLDPYKLNISIKVSVVYKDLFKVINLLASYYFLKALMLISTLTLITSKMCFINTFLLKSRLFLFSLAFLTSFNSSLFATILLLTVILSLLKSIMECFKSLYKLLTRLVPNERGMSSSMTNSYLLLLRNALKYL